MDTPDTIDAMELEGVATAAAAEEIECLRREVARLTQENRAYARSADILRAGVRTTVDELDTQFLAQAFARLAAQITSAERATVGVLEYDSIIAQAHYPALDSEGDPLGVTYVYPVDLKAGPGSGLAPRVVASAQTMTCHDPKREPCLGADFAMRHRVRSVACVPVLNHQSTVLAFIEVINRKGGALFTHDDLRALEALALAASVGFQRARLLDRLSEWSRSLEMLLGFNAAVNQHLDPVHLIRHLVENAGLFLKADGGMAGLSVQTAGGTAEMVCDGLWNRGVWHDWQRRWGSQEGLAGFVMENEFPYLSNEYPSDMLADLALVRDFDVRQALCVPIKDQDDAVIGFFELHRATPQTPFTWQDAAFLESLANVTAVSIRNAQLLKALEVRGEEIRALSANHVNRLEEERQHISRELHDEAGQILIGIKLALQVAARQIPSEHTNLRHDLDELRDQVNQATRRLKDLARWLRPPTLDQLGLEVALQQLASDLKNRVGFEVEVHLDTLGARLPQSWEIALYRVAQEALTNVLRHAEAERALLELRCDDHKLCLTVKDSGRGFDPTSIAGGLGLLGMKERAGMLGGALTVESIPGRGTEVRMEVPRP
ncbi:MAG TPA: GAF domain-containing protein [Edaphobacter sp.]